MPVCKADLRGLLDLEYRVILFKSNLSFKTNKTLEVCRKLIAYKNAPFIYR
jgi:hypothetical protein